MAPKPGKESPHRPRFSVRDISVSFEERTLLGLVKGRSGKGISSNLSETGLAFLTRESVDRGKHLRLTLKADTAMITVRLEGKVARCREVKVGAKDHAYQVGVSVGKPPEDFIRLVRMVRADQMLGLR